MPSLNATTPTRSLPPNALWILDMEAAILSPLWAPSRTAVLPSRSNTSTRPGRLTDANAFEHRAGSSRSPRISEAAATASPALTTWYSCQSAGTSWTSMRVWSSSTTSVSSSRLTSSVSPISHNGLSSSRHRSCTICRTLGWVAPHTTLPPGRKMPTLSVAISSTVEPRTSTWSRPTFVRTLTPLPRTLVASYEPPRPTSMTATSTFASRKSVKARATLNSKYDGGPYGEGCASTSSRSASASCRTCDGSAWRPSSCQVSLRVCT